MTIRAQYDADLAALKTAVAEMGGCAADAVEAALEALCTADADAAAAVIKGDGRINSMQRDIEHRCMTLLLRQQPVAGDPAVSDAIRMGQKAHKMLLDALDALTGEDESAAQKVIAADDEVDYDFNAIKRTLAAEIAADPAKVDAALDLLMVIKYLERIGDHAVNLAEWVEFLRTGRYQNEAMF